MGVVAGRGAHLGLFPRCLRGQFFLTGKGGVEGTSLAGVSATPDAIARSVSVLAHRQIRTSVSRKVACNPYIDPSGVASGSYRPIRRISEGCSRQVSCRG
jgi:hypothetical protein